MIPDLLVPDYSIFSDHHTMTAPAFIMIIILSTYIAPSAFKVLHTHYLTANL